MGNHSAGPGGALSGCTGNENPLSGLKRTDEFAFYGHVPNTPVQFLEWGEVQLETLSASVISDLGR